MQTSYLYVNTGKDGNYSADREGKIYILFCLTGKNIKKF